MSRPCSICVHQHRATIERGLRRRQPMIRLVKKFTVTSQALIRHRDLHMPDIPLSSVMPSETIPIQSPITVDMTHTNGLVSDTMNSDTMFVELLKISNTRLGNIERFLVGLMDRLEQSLGNEAGLDILDPPIKRVQAAWQDAKGDAQEQARIVAWLNDQLQADDMGLP